MPSILEQPGQRKETTAALDDPLNLFSPSYEPGPVSQRHKATFASAQIETTSKAQTYLQNVEPTFSDPLLRPSTLDTQYVPKNDLVKAKKSARDAWFAVMVLGSFIAGGIYFIVERIGGDAVKIDVLTSKVEGLTKQLNAERGVMITRNKELKLVNEQLTDERRKATAKRR